MNVVEAMLVSMGNVNVILPETQTPSQQDPDTSEARPQSTSSKPHQCVSVHNILTRTHAATHTHTHRERERERERESRQLRGGAAELARACKECEKRFY